MTAAGVPAEELPSIVDLVVIGSGAAGLAAAVTAASKGLRVAVFEKHMHLGGTSAWSGGAMWIPSGLSKQPDPAAVKYLVHELGPAVFDAQRAKILAYLTRGPKMVTHFRNLKQAPLHFEVDPYAPDFHVSQGCRNGGRILRVKAFDGTRLDRLDRLRPPLPEFTMRGIGIESGKELNCFLKGFRSPVSAVYVFWRLIKRLIEWRVHGRSRRLVNGNALVASLLAAAENLGVKLFAERPVLRLVRVDAARVSGVVVRTPKGEREVLAKHGVVLACGGFPHDRARIPTHFPHAPTGVEHKSAAPPENTGDGLRLGESAGGRVERTRSAPAAWAPVSLMQRRDGSKAVYPHFIDRAKPGVIAVNRAGRRFCDESGSYHDFMVEWIKASPTGGPLEAWLICDRRFLWRYGLDLVKPFSLLPKSWWSSWSARSQWRVLRTGYLQVGRTIESLAKTCGIESAGLRETVETYNHSVPSDIAFGRGSTAYGLSQGDPTVRPNPCVAAIRRPLYFAVRLYPGSLGTLAGLETDEHARVLDAGNRHIPGLYACGNDMASIMRGHYPGPGITLGPAMVFAYRAAMAIAKN